jgi:NADH dehydrogenase [ubiquinone] 1 alpha subcomplex assembly factor 7
MAISPRRLKSARCSANWSAPAWPIAGRGRDGRKACRYVELGPGRGTLAADALRVMKAAGLDPAVHFVEPAPILAKSAEAGGAGGHLARELRFACRLGRCCSSPTNFSMRFRCSSLSTEPSAGWRLRRRPGVRPGWRDRRGFARPPSAAASIAGTGIELCGGAGLIIDYGHARAGPGDTLQAVRGHRFRTGARFARRAGPDRPRRFRVRREGRARGGCAGHPVTTQGPNGCKARDQGPRGALGRAHPDAPRSLTRRAGGSATAMRWDRCSR